MPSSVAEAAGGKSIQVSLDIFLVCMPLNSKSHYLVEVMLQLDAFFQL